MGGNVQEVGTEITTNFKNKEISTNITTITKAPKGKYFTATLNKLGEERHTRESGKLFHKRKLIQKGILK